MHSLGTDLESVIDWGGQTRIPSCTNAEPVPLDQHPTGNNEDDAGTDYNANDQWCVVRGWRIAVIWTWLGAADGICLGQCEIHAVRQNIICPARVILSVARCHLAEDNLARASGQVDIYEKIVRNIGCRCAAFEVYRSSSPPWPARRPLMPPLSLRVLPTPLHVVWLESVVV